jgi:DNA-binding response OmpR family regulator
MEGNAQTARVLIIEDEQSLLTAMQDGLTANGFTISVAHDGEEGLKAALDQKPDLIILDVLMPKMDGMTMLKKLREDEMYGKHAKVIILTNLDADDKMVTDVVETQPTYYLIKSDVNIDGISAKVKEVLED